MDPRMTSRKSIQIRHGMCIYNGDRLPWSSRTTIAGRVLASHEVVIGTASGVLASQDPGWVRIEPGVYEKVVSSSDIVIESEVTEDVIVTDSDSS